MMVPVLMKQLHKSHPAFNQPPRLQTIGRKTARLPHVRTIHFQNRLRFAGKIRGLRHAGLHAKCHFILSNPIVDDRIQSAFIFIMMQLS